MQPYRLDLQVAVLEVAHLLQLLSGVHPLGLAGQNISGKCSLGGALTRTEPINFLTPLKHPQISQRCSCPVTVTHLASATLPPAPPILFLASPDPTEAETPVSGSRHLLEPRGLYLAAPQVFQPRSWSSWPGLPRACRSWKYQVSKVFMKLRSTMRSQITFKYLPMRRTYPAGMARLGMLMFHSQRWTKSETKYLGIFFTHFYLLHIIWFQLGLAATALLGRCENMPRKI